MKKFAIGMALVMAFVAGYFAKGFAPTWDYQRGIGQTEVKADYDLAIGDEVYYEILLWDEEYENAKVVERGFCSKDELAELSETAGIYEPVFEAGFRR